METPWQVEPTDQRSTSSRRGWVLAVAVTTIAFLGSVGVGLSGGVSAEQAANQGAAVAGTVSLSGSVTAPQAFTAAQVHVRNVDRNILYMVFTQAGRFRAVALFPGNYEVSVQAPGLASDVQKVALRAGDQPTVALRMLATAETQTGSAAGANVSLPDGGAGLAAGGGLTLLPYDEIYPPGPGKEVAEQVCMACHGENFFPSRPGNQATWASRIDHMVGTELTGRDARSYAEGLLSYRSNVFRWSAKDREELLGYLVKNFGPGSGRRAVRTERPMPIDEAALGKAMFIEYYMKPDGPNEGVNAPEFKGRAEARYIQDPRFDNDGNVWLIDRGIPERLVKLDPRTGEQKNFLQPDPVNGNHEVLVDRSGMIWMAEHRGLAPSNQKRLLMFNPKTERFEKAIPMDPDNVVRNSIKWLQSLAIDSKDNIYVGWIMGGALSKYEAATGKVTVYRVPTPHAIPYGVIADQKDNIWIALWSGGKLVRFDPTNESFAEFTPPTYPGHIRRLNVDSKNNIWTGIWAAGKRPGKLAKLDQTTGRWTEWSIPQQNAQPYDVAEDAEGKIWFTDSPTPDRQTALGRFDPGDGTFTFYPKPQFGADTPKIQVTKDGAVWFAPRGSRGARAAISVLYPDMSKISNLGAYYLNGPPGYPFKVARPGTAN